MPSWPTTRGFVLADGFKNTLPVVAERSTVDSGPVKQRRNSVARPQPVSFRTVMTSTDRDWLVDFYLGTGGAEGGAVWFTWTHPATLDTVQARFIADKPPAYEPYKPDWIVTVDLEWRAL